MNKLFTLLFIGVVFLNYCQAQDSISVTTKPNLPDVSNLDLSTKPTQEETINWILSKLQKCATKGYFQAKDDDGTLTRVTKGYESNFDFVYTPNNHNGFTLKVTYILNMKAISQIKDGMSAKDNNDWKETFYADPKDLTNFAFTTECSRYVTHGLWEHPILKLFFTNKHSGREFIEIPLDFSEEVNLESRMTNALSALLKFNGHLSTEIY